MLATTITVLTTSLVTLGIGLQLLIASRLGTCLLRNKFARCARCEPTGGDSPAAQRVRGTSPPTLRVRPRARPHRPRSYRVALRSGQRRAGQSAGL